MKITWLGHSGFRIEIEQAQCCWSTRGSPATRCSPGREDEALAGATHILLTHAHGDHASDAAAISRETGAPLVHLHP
jgi:L-ascorbate metabolism protein UlaG (beta-lactamase superfamily)